MLGWIDAKIKDLPRGILPGSGALHRDVRKRAQREQLLAALKLIAVMPEAAAFRRDQQVKAAAERDPAWMTNDAEPGALSARSGGP